MRSVHRDAVDGHLSREALARLVDDAASPAEGRHLEGCDICRDELSALVAQTRALSELPDIEPASEDWEAIEARLGERNRDFPASLPMGEATRPSAVLSFPERPRHTGWIRAAAGVALFLGGGVTGAMMTSGFSPPTEPDRGESVAAGAVEPGAGAVESDAGVVEPDAGVVEPDAGAFSLSDSEALVGATGDLYMGALLEYRQRVAQTDPTLAVRDPVGRLVMLENLLAASEAAVREAPADPFFNGLLASTTAEHRAVVAEMAALTTPTW